MKNTITLLLLIISSALFSQKTEYYLKKGYIAEGYDVVSYFNKKPLEGNKKYQSIYDGVKFKFSSEKNLALFKENPTKYIPQYGGYCAYAIGKTGEKVGINPKTFEIRDGKLYLFYNSWGTNTLKLWLKENPQQLKKQADINWKKRIHR